MTLVYTDGFETCANDSDFRARGWVGTTGTIRASFVPSFTNMSGTSLSYAANSASTAGLPGSSASIPDVGYFNTGVTVHNAWVNGGFSFGFAVETNPAATINVAGGGVINQQLCYDGTNYWTIGYNSSTKVYSVMYSSDLIKWTVSPTQPATLGAYATIYFLGDKICVGANVSVAVNTANSGLTAPMPQYYTTNNGASWTQYPKYPSVVLPAPGQYYSSPSYYSYVENYYECAAGFNNTGNTTFPDVIFYQYAFISGNGGSYSTTYGGVLVGDVTNGSSVTQLAFSSVNYSTPCNIRNIGGNIFLGSGTVLHWCPANSTTMNTAAAWTSITMPTNTIDINYFATSNVWVIATTAGTYYTNNTGQPGTPVPPAANATWLKPPSSAGVSFNRVEIVNNTLVATGLSQLVYTSPDGVNWTSTQSTINSGGWYNSVFVNNQLVLVSDTTNGIVATTPDGVTNWNTTYNATSLEGLVTGYNGCIGVYNGTAPTAAGTFTANANYIGVKSSAISSGNRTFSLAYNNASASATTFVVANSPNYHYIELTAIPGTAPNTFTLELSVDSNMVSSVITPIQFGTGQADTGSLLILSLGRDGTFIGLDDLYFTINDGNGVSGPLGPVNLVARRPTVDTSDMWQTNSGVGTNSHSVNQKALSSNANNFITSQNTGDKDVYKSTDAIPTGFKPIAVVAEAYVSRVSTTQPTVNIGVISNGVESDSPNLLVTSTGNTYISQVYQEDPNGNKPWSNASVTNLGFTLNHVS